MNWVVCSGWLPLGGLLLSPLTTRALATATNHKLPPAKSSKKDQHLIKKSTKDKQGFCLPPATNCHQPICIYARQKLGWTKYSEIAEKGSVWCMALQVQSTIEFLFATSKCKEKYNKSTKVPKGINMRWDWSKNVLRGGTTRAHTHLLGHKEHIKGQCKNIYGALYNPYNNPYIILALSAIGRLIDLLKL